MANKRFLDFTTDETPSGSSFILEADSVNGVRKTTIEKAVAATDAFANINTKVSNLWDNAAAHNGIYRGQNITAYFESGEMSQNIANGTFDNIYIGDFIVKTIELPAITYTNKSGASVTQAAQTFSNVKWQVAGLDTHLNCGDETANTHHVVLIPSTALQKNVAMNPTDTTEGGYVGSDIWQVHMPIWSNAIKNAFGGEHVLRHRELLTNNVNAEAQAAAGGFLGKSSGFIWTTVEANIPNEAMIYGGKVFGSSHDVGEMPKILPLFALKNHYDDSTWFWLRAIASASSFCMKGTAGNATYGGAANNAVSGGICPYFLLK